jgi:hypothetical protein
MDAAGTEESESVGGSAGAAPVKSFAAGSAGVTKGGKASTSSSGSGGIKDNKAVDGIGERGGKGGENDDGKAVQDRGGAHPPPPSPATAPHRCAAS